MASSGWAGRLIAHPNLVWGRSTSARGFYSLFEGVEAELSDCVALDVSMQHVGLRSVIDRQVLVGLTVSLGHFR